MTNQYKISGQGLRFRAPARRLDDDFYLPAMSRVVRYDRCCAFSSDDVLADAAHGFGGFVQNLRALGVHAPKPSVRLLLVTTGDQTSLIEKLLKEFKTSKDPQEKNRLEMFAWMVASGLLEIRVGLMRNAQGLPVGNFGIIADQYNDRLVFVGGVNDTADAENYTDLELSTSWQDNARADYYRNLFDMLWDDGDENIVTLPLPQAVRLRFIELAPKEPPELTHE